MISYYTLPSTVVNNPVHKSIKAAYAFYNVATTMSLQDLILDALVLAKNVHLLLQFVNIIWCASFKLSYIFGI